MLSLSCLLNEYTKLPGEIKRKIKNKETLEAIHFLEKEHKIKIATLIMRLMIGDILLDELEEFLVKENDLTFQKAKEIRFELEKKVLNPVIKYLQKLSLTKKKDNDYQKGITQESSIIEEKIKQLISMGIAFPLGDNQFLIKRLKNIIRKYFKDEIDEIQIKRILTQDSKLDGLDYFPEEAERAMKFIKEYKNKLFEPQEENKQPAVKSSQTISISPAPALSEKKTANLEKKYLEEEGEKK